MSDIEKMAAFGASELACYRWPGDTAQDRACRAAYCDGAAWSAAEIDRLRPIEAAARNLTALWQAQKISGLPRADRNAAIEESRERLIAVLNQQEPSVPK